MLEFAMILIGIVWWLIAIFAWVMVFIETACNLLYAIPLTLIAIVWTALIIDEV